jgi:hypothetical protein
MSVFRVDCTPLPMSGTAVLAQNAILVPLLVLCPSLSQLSLTYTVYAYILLVFSWRFRNRRLAPVATCDRPKTTKTDFMKFGIDGS